MMWNENDMPPPDLIFADKDLLDLARTLLIFQHREVDRYPLSAYVARMFLRSLSEEATTVPVVESDKHIKLIKKPKSR